MGRAAAGRGLRPAARIRGGGFTYVELVATAFVIVIMAGVSLPLLLPRYREYQMRSAVWQVAGDLRLARQRAVTTRNPYRFSFVAEGDATADATTRNTYVIEYSPRQGAAWVQEIPLPPGTRKRLGSPILIQTGSTPSTRTITFNPNGSVVPGATLQLAGRGGGAASVVVDQAGRVQVR
jgi:Tfp pilus assembly protein FimT